MRMWVQRDKLNEILQIPIDSNLTVSAIIAQLSGLGPLEIDQGEIQNRLNQAIRNTQVYNASHSPHDPNTMGGPGRQRKLGGDAKKTAREQSGDRD